MYMLYRNKIGIMSIWEMEKWTSNDKVRPLKIIKIGG